MELVITLEELPDRVAVFGTADRHLRLVRDAFGIRIIARDSTLKLEGESARVGKAAAVIDRLQQVAADRGHVAQADVEDVIADLAGERAAADRSGLHVFAKGGSINPKTQGQREYVDAMLAHDLTICLGPAGTGKTFLAVAVALSMLKANKIRRVVLARPAVEAGEKLGYLPGDLQAKVNPYLRPLFDAMHDMMDFEHFRRLMANDVIEVIPLAFMRGRTLNHSAVILDEAQNTTVQQMLMFLTRLGERSKMIVTGDDSQVDLPGSQRSGLYDAVQRLQHLSQIAIVRLSQADIVRHKLVTHIVDAYATDAPRRGGDVAN